MGEKKNSILKFLTRTTECWCRFLIWGAVKRSSEGLELGVQVWAIYCDHHLTDLCVQSCWIYRDRWVCVLGESSVIEGNIGVIWVYMVFKARWLDQVLEERNWLYTEKMSFVKNEPWILKHLRVWKKEAESVNMIDKVQPVNQEEYQVFGKGVCSPGSNAAELLPIRTGNHPQNLAMWGSLAVLAWEERLGRQLPVVSTNEGVCIEHRQLLLRRRIPINGTREMGWNWEYNISWMFCWQLEFWLLRLKFCEKWCSDS